jgi:hypothetical protein
LDYSIPSNSATELKEMLKHKWHKQGLYSWKEIQGRVEEVNTMDYLQKIRELFQE